MTEEIKSWSRRGAKTSKTFRVGLGMCCAFLWLTNSLDANAGFQKLHVEDGTLLFEDGAEVNLWGVNLQPSLSWEYLRMTRHGLHQPLELDAYRAMINEAYDELEMLGCNLIRIHLSPGDITDTAGNLVENQWLDLTDYVLAEAERRGMYTYLAFLNTLGGARGKDSFVSRKDETKPVWMVDPEFISKADHYMHQLLNRKNKYAEGRKYKQSPALAIVEPINEPGYFTRDNIEDKPSCFAVYQGWLEANGREDSAGSFTTWRTEHTRNYINRMVRFFKDEGVSAPMSWSMEWPRMMEWTGEDVFDAAAESDAEIVSICFYPGQAASHGKKGEELKAVGGINYLDYIKQAYSARVWNGWMREDRFKSKARIVYEFETYHNQTSYLYPAMAKYFRAQGIQAAAMWTYILPGEAEYTAAAHNLNLKTTPNKAAAFMAAREVMKSQPRYEPYSTTSATDDYSGNTALSYDLGCSAYGTSNQWIYSEAMPQCFIDHLPPLSEDFERIVGRGNSPYAKYGGSGLYFIESQNGKGVTIKILPDAEFQIPYYLRNERGEKAVRLSTDASHTFELNLPGFGSGSTVFHKVGDRWKTIKRQSGSVRFEAKPGEEYAVRK